MATDIIDELDKDQLRKTIFALKAWFGYQSSTNAADLYNQTSKLFKSDFNPAEYDSVE